MVILDDAKAGFITPLLRLLLRLTSGEVLLQLIVTSARFKALQQVLRVDVLDHRSLHNARQALENTTAISVPSFIVYIDSCVTLSDGVALDTGLFLLQTVLLAYDERGRNSLRLLLAVLTSR